MCAVTVLAAVLSGCSREKEDWRSAQAADTAAAYEQFLSEHPASDQAASATTRLAQLAEEDDWQRAATQDHMQGYQQFLTRHPEGKWAQEARIRVENFAIADPSAPPADSPSAPQPAVAEPQVTPPAAAQLGAFSTPAAAESQWQQLIGRFKKELAGLPHRVVAGEAASGTVHRLQVPMPTEAAARQLCEQLKVAGQACVLGRT